MLRQFANLREGFGKKEEGGVFEEGLINTPMHTTLCLKICLFAVTQLGLQEMYGSKKNFDAHS